MNREEAGFGCLQPNPELTWNGTTAFTAIYSSTQSFSLAIHRVTTPSPYYHHPNPIFTALDYLNHPSKCHTNTKMSSIINSTIINIKISNPVAIGNGVINTGKIGRFYDGAVVYRCAANMVRTGEGMVRLHTP